MYNNKSIAVVIPAFNEADSIALVVGELLSLKNESGSTLLDDIVVCDNNSTDSTAALAQAAGARVVQENRQGYGAACLTGIAALRHPDIVVFVDADHSVVASELPKLLKELRTADLAIGSRTLGQSQRGALSWPQRAGNRLACYLIELLWSQPSTDLGPFRAICFDALKKLEMKDQKFGWTVEMQVKAIQYGLAISEIPVTSLKRIGRSKISGTVKGVLGASGGILGMILKLWWQQRSQQAQLHKLWRLAELSVTI